MDRYLHRYREQQAVVETTVLLRHPKSGYLHAAHHLESMDICNACDTGFSGISISLAACGANLPGTPPDEDQERQWFHGGFDVVNLVDEPSPKGKRCTRCFGERKGE